MKFNGHFMRAFAAMILALSTTAAFAADTVEYLPAKPLVDTLKSTTLKPVKAGVLRVPTITWPGDVSTIHTAEQGIFKQEGLNVELFCENDFAKQVQGVIDGETPVLRGTVGMMNSAAEAFAKAGTELVVVYQLTWSSGGDCMVVRPGIKSLSDLKGKTVVLQLYGPHMDFLTTTLNRGLLKPSDVKVKWVKELTLPLYDTKGRLVDPRSTFVGDAGVDASMVISPDAAAITSGGAEGVKDSKVLFSSKTANRIIADVYAFRKDWYEQNKDTVEKFTHSLMLGQESFEALLADKANNQAKYSQLLSKSADLLFGSPNATADVEGSLGDCEWVGYQGNVAFFTGANTLRSLDALNDEVQTALIDLSLMKAKTPLRSAGWDYLKLAKDLTKVDLNAVPKAKFDTSKVQQAVENQIATELDSYEETKLYSFEIYFAPKNPTFTAALYKEAFEQALQFSQTLGGALITIEGHNAPDAIYKAQEEGQSTQQIAALEQAAKTLSYQRAEAVRKAYLEFCKDKGLLVDASQFVPVGLGVKSPKNKTWKTKAEWDANRRVVFRIKAVETEMEDFKPRD